MKRLHVQVSVADLSASIRFYAKLFGTAPSATKDDYAKKMLEDPTVNIAISVNRQSVGVNHLGIRIVTDDELKSMEKQLTAADKHMIPEGALPCRCARSNKDWVTDPTGTLGRPSTRSGTSRCVEKTPLRLNTASRRRRSKRAAATCRKSKDQELRSAARHD